MTLRSGEVATEISGSESGQLAIGIPGLSANLRSFDVVFAALDGAKSYGFAAVERQLRATKGYRGATGTIRINPKTGYRTNVPVSILRVDNRKRFVIAK